MDLFDLIISCMELILHSHCELNCKNNCNPSDKENLMHNCRVMVNLWPTIYEKMTLKVNLVLK